MMDWKIITLVTKTTEQVEQVGINKNPCHFKKKAKMSFRIIFDCLIYLLALCETLHLLASIIYSHLFSDLIRISYAISFHDAKEK